ncbi:MAG: PepSY domain-containing protein [Gammaproteobacteria bacterium]|jgi:uncharacterized membrane protein YkoI
MKAKPTLPAVLAGFVLATGSVAAYAGDLQGLDKAKLGLEQAAHVARQTVPGKVLKAELERERGGSGLRWSFDIRDAHNLREVGVDAVTGKVLENTLDRDSHEGDRADSEED